MIVHEEMITGSEKGANGEQFQIDHHHLSHHGYHAIHTSDESKYVTLQMLFPGTVDEWIVVSGHINPKHGEILKLCKGTYRFHVQKKSAGIHHVAILEVSHYS